MKHKTRPRMNAKGYPYIPAKLVENNWRIYIEYWVYSFDENKLIRKRTSKFAGNSPSEKKQSAKTKITEINEILSMGYMIGKTKAKVKKKRLTILEGFNAGVKFKTQTTGKVTTNSYNSYNKIFNEYLTYSKKTKTNIKDFDQSEVYQFFDYLFEVRNVGNRTRNNYKDFLRAIFNELIARKIISENPCNGIKDLSVPSGKNIPFTPEEEKILKSYLRKEMPELYLFTRFIYFGFLRPIDLTRMLIKHIDLPNRIILVRSNLTKNKKQMPVAITSQLEKVIIDMKLDQYPQTWYIFSKNGLKPGPDEMIRNRVSEMHKTALEETGLYNKELTLYSWKHTGNCNAYRAGLDIKSIQSQNRHHSLQMTEIYLRSLGLRISSDLKNLEW